MAPLLHRAAINRLQYNVLNTDRQVSEHQQVLCRQRCQIVHDLLGRQRHIRLGQWLVSL